MENKTISFVSFISRDDKPLYIQSFDLDKSSDPNDSHNANNFLKYNFLSHMALDIITSPTSMSIREQQQQATGDENKVLLLVVQDDISVYGYESNTGLKIIIGFDNNTKVVDQNVNDLIKSIYKYYIKTICNPFVEVGDDENILQTETFNKNIEGIVTKWNGA